MSLDNIKQRLTTLSQNSPHLHELLSKERLKRYHSRTSFLNYYYGFSQLTDEGLDLLEKAAHETQVFEHLNKLLSGEKINTSENRAVSHHNCRNPETGYYQKNQKQALSLGNRVFTNDLNNNSTPYKTIVQIGIGGSELGPKAIYHALHSMLSSEKTARFIASIDPVGFRETLSTTSIEDCLFVIVSKSGSTFETTENINQLREYIETNGHTWQSIQNQVVVITCPSSTLDQSDLGHHRLYMSESIGGRFSVTSPVGTFILTCCFGEKIVLDFLNGAYEHDQSSTNHSLSKNPSLTAALVSYWERCYLNYNSQAIISYSHALKVIPSHLQQLFCESLGKHHTIDNKHLKTPSGKLVFGEEGPNAQHSFFQLLHQGDTIIPVQFLSIRSPLVESDSPYHKGLIHSMTSQIHALAYGKEHTDAPHQFLGNRPSTTVLIETLSPQSLGALASFYENMVFFEGILLNINTFDQPGVELGKSVMRQLNEKETPEILSELALLLQ